MTNSATATFNDRVTLEAFNNEKALPKDSFSFGFEHRQEIIDSPISPKAESVQRVFSHPGTTFSKFDPNKENPDLPPYFKGPGVRYVFEDPSKDGAEFGACDSGRLLAGFAAGKVANSTNSRGETYQRFSLNIPIGGGQSNIESHMPVELSTPAAKTLFLLSLDSMGVTRQDALAHIQSLLSERSNDSNLDGIKFLEKTLAESIFKESFDKVASKDWYSVHTSLSERISAGEARLNETPVTRVAKSVSQPGFISLQNSANNTMRIPQGIALKALVQSEWVLDSQELASGKYTQCHLPIYDTVGEDAQLQEVLTISADAARIMLLYASQESPLTAQGNGALKSAILGLGYTGGSVPRPGTHQASAAIKGLSNILN